MKNLVALMFLFAAPALSAQAQAQARAQAQTPSLAQPDMLSIAGGVDASTCSNHARAAADGLMAPAIAVETCTEALQIEQLSARDLAATYTNRGVLYLTMAENAQARSDFEAAAKVEPSVGEAWIDQGVVEVRMGLNEAAVADINHGLALDVKEPWKAYFNRGVARENLGDLKGAYADYAKAAELKPDWPAPKTEMARFAVKAR